MAIENNEVVYQYTGDVSSLATATKQAIDYLGQYESTVKELTKAGQFKISKTAYNSFNKTINSLTKEVNSLVSSLNKSTQDMQDALSPDVSHIVSASNDIKDALAMLQDSASVTAQDIKFLTEFLKDTQTTMAAVADKAKILSSDFKELQTLNMPTFADTPVQNVRDLAQETQQTSAAIQHSIQDITDAYSGLTDIDAFRSFVQNTSNYFAQANKSAEESAHIFETAEQRQIEAAKEYYKSLVQNAPFVAFAQQAEQAFGRIHKAANESADVFTSASVHESADVVQRTYSSLVNEVTGYLKQLESLVKDSVLTGNLNLNKTAFNSFQKAVRDTTKEFNDLTGAISQSPIKVQQAMAADASLVGKSTQEIGSLLSHLKNIQMNKGDIKSATDSLKNMELVIALVNDKVKSLRSGLQQLSDDAMPKSATVAQSSATDIANAYKEMVDNAPFRAFAQQVEEAYSRVNKSARESAEVFTSPSTVQFEDKLERIRSKSDEVANSIKATFDRLKDVFAPFISAAQGTVSQMQSIKDKAKEAADRVKMVWEAAGSGFRQFRGEAEDAASAHNELGSAINDVNTASTRESHALQNEDKTLQKKNRSLKSAHNWHSRLGRAISGVGAVITVEIGRLSRYTKSIYGASQATQLLQKVISVTAVYKLGSALMDLTKKAIEYVENLNLFTVAMGDSLEEATAFVSKMSEIYGMDPSNLLRYSGYFYQLTDAIGMTNEASKAVSLSLTKASNDIASLFNVDIETVVENLASGMQGMSRAVKKYGIDIRNATLQQTALNYGFTENISTTSEANRQALRYLTMMNQVRNATMQTVKALEDYNDTDFQELANRFNVSVATIREAFAQAMAGNTQMLREFGIEVDTAGMVLGDFARNIETPANQLRILKEQASVVARAFGNFFIPVMQKVLYVVNGVMMAIATLLKFLGSLIGIDVSGFGGSISAGAAEAASGVGDIGDAAEGSADKLKKLIAPFDELTILTEPDVGGGGGGVGGGIGGDALDPGLLAALEEMQLALDDVRMKALDVRDKILEILGLEYDGETVSVVIGGFIDDLINLWNKQDYTGFGKRIAEFLNQGIAWGIEHTDPKKYMAKIKNIITTITSVLNGLIQGLNWKGLGTIIGNGITLALYSLNTAITSFNWYELGEALANLLNGILEAIDWALLGEYLANRINKWIYSIKGFIENFDWRALGENLGTAFASWVENVDLSAAMSALASLVNGLLETIQGFMSKYKWGTVGSKLAQGLNKAFKEINWANLGKTISNVLTGIVNEIKEFVTTLDWHGVCTAIIEFVKNIDWWGLFTDLVETVFTLLGDVVGSLVYLLDELFKGVGEGVSEIFKDGILSGLANIGAWIWDNIFQPIYNGFCNAFGISNGESSEMHTIGTALITGGLAPGMASGMIGMDKNIEDNIGHPIINTFKSVLGVSSGASHIFKQMGEDTVEGLYQGIDNRTTWQKIKDWGNALLLFFGNIFGGCSSAVGDMVYTINYQLSLLSSKFDLVTEAAHRFQNSVRNTQITTSLSTPTNSSSGGYKKPLMATGGVVRGPTDAIIGEGRYNEAVIPLGNSPELQDMIDRIASAVSNIPAQTANTNTQPIEVYVYIDGQELTTVQNNTNRMYGRTQQNI